LRGSFAGIFRVGALAPGRGLVLEDLAGLGTYACGEAEASLSLESGDLIVGRLHPIAADVHLLSPAAGYIRDPELSSAIEQDIERLREQRLGKVLRISQVEIERLFFGVDRPRRRQVEVACEGGSSAPPPFDAGVAAGDAVGEARLFLRNSGVSDARIEHAFGRLAVTSREVDRWVLGAGDALGEILDELAFETDVDLGRARVLLLKAWSALREGAAPSSPPTPEHRPETGPDPRRALAEFEATRLAGGDLEQAFAQLERDLGLEDEPDTEEAESENPALPSILPALIEEFLWEREQQPDSARAALTEARASLETLARFGSDVSSIDDLDERWLLRFLTFWVWEHDAVAADRRSTVWLSVFEEFCIWLEHAHDLGVWTNLRATLVSLRRTLPRIARANQARPRDHGLGEDDLGELYEIVELDLAGRAQLLSRDGHSVETRLGAELAADLETGDRLRLHQGKEGTTVLCCYPPEIAELFAV
jgi:hypothetical protein